tara:strand:- start:246 stop:656 length:411 start_codon:yes stop_codon:yes gene_type:complete
MIHLLLSTLISCTLTTETPADFSQFISCRRGQQQVNVVQDWRPLIEKYFEPQDVDKAMRIIFCESSGRSNAVGKNTNGTRDVGLWQFNDETWRWLKPKLKIQDDRFDAETSTAVASWLVYNDGWFHWNSSKHCWGK